MRTAPAALGAGDLALKLTGDDGSVVSFTFPVAKADPENGAARAVEHLHVNGWLLRPGAYTIGAVADGATATAKIEVFSHVRRSTFRLINWGRAKDKEALPQGEDNLGYNLFFGNPGEPAHENFIRAGVDFMSVCTMSGGHQMDLRQECDWSDPYVIRGGTRRVAHRALMDRTRPNVPGVHFYDEPGLTWMKDPATGESTPHAVPSQAQAFEAAFGAAPLDYKKVDPANPEHVARWNHWARWKLGFMDAAWKDAQFGVQQVRPDFLSVTQSQYGWTAFTDGYYFNVVRTLPVISGHGGYHDFGARLFQPVALPRNSARARLGAAELVSRDVVWPDHARPVPAGAIPFQTNIQGMMSPPDLEPGGGKSSAMQGIVESNKRMARLGTIFTTMSVTRPPVAVLYSLSNSLHLQTQDRNRNYAHDSPQGRGLTFTYLAGKRIQQPLMAVVGEDLLDGTLAAEHKEVILTSLDHLDAHVIAALERFAKGGGLVLMTADCKVKIAGAIDLGIAPRFADQPKIDELVAAKKYEDAGKLPTLRHALAGAQPLADALRRELGKAGIQPVFSRSTILPASGRCASASCSRTPKAPRPSSSRRSRSAPGRRASRHARFICATTARRCSAFSGRISR